MLLSVSLLVQLIPHLIGGPVERGPEIASLNLCNLRLSSGETEHDFHNLRSVLFIKDDLSALRSTGNFCQLVNPC